MTHHTQNQKIEQPARPHTFFQTDQHKMEIYTAVAMLNHPTGYSGLIFERFNKYKAIIYLTNFGIDNIETHEEFKEFMNAVMRHQTAHYKWTGNIITYNAAENAIDINIWSQHVCITVDTTESYNYMFDLLEAIRVNAESHLDSFIR
jgi:choline kinase